jgi:hypothetical protein
MIVSIRRNAILVVAAMSSGKGVVWRKKYYGPMRAARQTVSP